MAIPRGKLVTPVGFNPSGSPLALEVDANGYLKIVLTGAAGSDLLTELGQKLETADLNIEAVSKDLQVDVKSAPITTVTQTTPANLLVSTHGYVNAAWRKNPILFGYSSVYAEALTNLSLPAGSSVLVGSTVPAGQVWVITNVVALYAGTVPTSIAVYLSIGAISVNIFRQPSPVSYSFYDRQGWWVLEAGNYAACAVVGATLNDDLYFQLCGFKIQINL